MKFYPNNIASLLSSIKSGIIKSVLIYGPDKGIIHDMIDKIRLGTDLPTKFSSLENSINIVDLNNISLFSQKEIIIINYNKQSIDKDGKDALMRDNLNFSIIIADDLQTSSSLRKFFEFEKNLASLSCYPDDEKSLRSIIISKLSSQNITIDQDSIIYLVKELYGNRFILYNEIDKLIAYIHPKKNVTIEDCIVVSKNTDNSTDKLSISFIESDIVNYNYELEKLISSNISPVWVVRAISRFLINMIIVKLNMTRAVSVEEAISKIKPPIFFKILPKFKSLCLSTSIEKIHDMLEEVTISEIQLKSNFEASNVFNNLIYKSHSKKSFF